MSIEKLFPKYTAAYSGPKSLALDNHPTPKNLTSRINRSESNPKSGPKEPESKTLHTFAGEGVPPKASSSEK
jgi:hypothetical protein